MVPVLAPPVQCEWLCFPAESSSSVGTSNSPLLCSCSAEHPPPLGCGRLSSFLCLGVPGVRALTATHLPMFRVEPGGKMTPAGLSRLCPWPQVPAQWSQSSRICISPDLLKMHVFTESESGCGTQQLACCRWCGARRVSENRGPSAPPGGPSTGIWGHGPAGGLCSRVLPAIFT